MFAGLLLVAAGSSAARAETVVDVSRQWQEHASSSPVAISSPAASRSSSANLSEAEPVDCACENRSVGEKLSLATFAFTGMAESTSSVKQGYQRVTFDVDEIFKGSPGSEADIVTEIAGTPCDFIFEEGKKYLVYARWEWGRYVTTRCMGTKSIDIARGDASALGPSEAMKDKLYKQLHDACMGRRDTLCCLDSLKAMRAGYYVPEPETGCPAGDKPDRLRCAGSYTWCISENEKDHRKQDR